MSTPSNLNKFWARISEIKIKYRHDKRQSNTVNYNHILSQFNAEKYNAIDISRFGFLTYFTGPSNTQHTYLF